MNTSLDRTQIELQSATTDLALEIRERLREAWASLIDAPSEAALRAVINLTNATRFCELLRDVKDAAVGSVPLSENDIPF